MYDKRELLCNLWVLRAPWVTGNFTVQLCQIKSTGLPLPNFFLGEEQPSRIDLCCTVKEIMERVLSVTPFQDFYLDIEYFRPWLYRAFWPHPSPQPMPWHMTVTTIFLHLGHSKPHRHPSCDTWSYPQKYNLPVLKTRVRQGLPCQQLPAISRSTT